MINLKKTDTPVWIEENKEKKTAEYVTAPEGKKPSPWRADEIITALKDESFNKCMYCEGIIDDVSYSAVEHIKPKNKFQNLVLEWDNLGLACSRCNTNKGSYWTDTVELQLLNPYADEVSDHLKFVGPLTVAHLHSTRGTNTLTKLKFGRRQDLLMSRMRRIEELQVRLTMWHDEVDPEKKEIFAEAVRDAVSTEQEFSAVLRSYAIEAGFHVQPLSTPETRG
uniref:HNH endonuclease n=1 Tax=Rhodococcus qingshengii TaxID=334542 RepID=UPI001C4E2755|nr:HNH endonuclease [Rhodococcus qingshengii]